MTEKINDLEYQKWICTKIIGAMPDDINKASKGELLSAVKVAKQIADKRLEEIVKELDDCSGCTLS